MKLFRTHKFLSVVLITVVCGCSQTKFSPVDASSNTSLNDGHNDTGGGQTCSTNQISVSRPAKVLFVVDQSGSNVQGADGLSSVGTDPDKKFRLSVLQKFYNDYSKKENVSWGLAAFNNGQAKNLMQNSLGITVPFSSKASDFKNAITTFSKRSDVGGTPYKSALNLITGIIALDRLSAPAHVIYLVVFLTDGYPTDYCASDLSSSNCTGPTLNQKIFDDVVAIKNLVPDSVQLSTAYYGLPDTSAANRLQQMALAGSGQFVDTNKSTGVQLNDLIKVEQEVCVPK